MLYFTRNLEFVHDCRRRHRGKYAKQSVSPEDMSCCNKPHSSNTDAEFKQSVAYKEKRVTKN